MKRYRISVQGMTCTGCEEHVAVALENMGASGIEVDYHRGDAVFELPNGQGVETATKAIAEANYQPGKIEEVQSKELVQLGDEVDYDYIIIGTDGVDLSSCNEDSKYRAKMQINERKTKGVKNKNMSCITKNTML